MKNPPKSSKRIGVILCGGLGERFWPFSDETRPKYALRFGAKDTFLAATYTRLRELYNPSSLYVATAEEHAGLVRKLLPRISSKQIIAEPLRRNTAAAVTLATLLLSEKHGPDAVISFFPADAMILGTDRFVRILRKAQHHAERNPAIILVGVRPTYPATGYGYIEAGKRTGTSGAFLVKGFVEKPPLRRAEHFIKTRRHFWNTGIFTWSPKLFFAEMQAHAPDYLRRFRRLFGVSRPPESAVRGVFKRLPSVAIDRLLIEKSRRRAVFCADFGWDDIGTWESLRRIAPDGKGNVVCARGVFENLKDSVIFSEDLHVAACGLDGVVIAQKGPYLLICGPGKSQEVSRLRRQILSQISPRRGR